MDGDVGAAFGGGHESGEGESGIQNGRLGRERSFDLRRCQAAVHLDSKCEHSGVIDSPVVVVGRWRRSFVELVGR